MKLKRVMLAAPKSGSGKTTITCALLWALKDTGQRVAAYKCGPDYIDPMFHKKVIDIPSKNLDTFFTGRETTKALFLKNRTEEDFAVLEGVMGLFDGLGGIREEGSSYDLAKLTRTPIILVVDAKGMGRSIIPLLAGFLTYDKEQFIKGVILNRMSKSYYEIIKPLIEEELKLCVVGYFPDCKKRTIESRHLGLLLPDELEDIKGQIKEAAKELQRTVSLEEIIRIAEESEELEYKNTGISREEASNQKCPVIGVAKDEAFCFYYEDNLLMLEENGAKIKYFSPLYDKKLPDGLSGILLGGGYPELYAQQLSENTELLIEIKAAIAGGMPVVAECGGFMYLHSTIIDKKDDRYALAGVLPGSCQNTGRLVRFGYIELEEKKSHFLPEGERIRGHEFHYFDSTDNGNDCLAIKPATQKNYSCVFSGETYWLGFPHLYYPSNPVFARSFVEKARNYKRKDK